MRRAFFLARSGLAPAGTPEHHAIVSVLRALADEQVPLVSVGDLAIPHGMARPVPGTELLVCYVPAGDEVFIVNLVRAR